MVLDYSKWDNLADSDEEPEEGAEGSRLEAKTRAYQGLSAIKHRADERFHALEDGEGHLEEYAKVVKLYTTALDELQRYQDCSVDPRGQITADEREEESTWRMSCLLNRAAAGLKCQAYAMTVEDCTAALKIDRGTGKAYHFRGHALVRLGRPSEALQDYRSAVKILGETDPAVTREYEALRASLEQKVGARSAPAVVGPDARAEEEEEEEEALLLRLVRSSGSLQQRARACLRLGSLYQKAGRVSEAVDLVSECLEAALPEEVEEAETFARLHHLAGGLYYKKGEADEARKHYQRGLDVLKSQEGGKEAPGSERGEVGIRTLLMGDLGISLVKGGDYQAAVPLLESSQASYASLTGQAQHSPAWRRRQLFVLEALSDALAAVGDLQRGQDVAKEGASLAEELGLAERAAALLKSCGCMLLSAQDEGKLRAATQVAALWERAARCCESAGVTVKAAQLRIDAGHLLLEAAGKAPLMGGSPGMAEEQALAAARDHFSHAESLLADMRKRKESSTQARGNNCLRTASNDDHLRHLEEEALSGQAFAAQDFNDALESLLVLRERLYSEAGSGKRSSQWHARFARYSYAAALAAGRVKRVRDVEEFLNEAYSSYQAIGDKAGLQSIWEGRAVLRRLLGDERGAEVARREAEIYGNTSNS